MAAPMPMPAKPSSEIGVSMTRRGAEPLEHPLADLVGAVVLGDFLAHQEDAVVALHLLGHRLVRGFAIGKDRHDHSCGMIRGHGDVFVDGLERRLLGLCSANSMLSSTSCLTLSCIRSIAVLVDPAALLEDVLVDDDRVVAGRPTSSSSLRRYLAGSLIECPLKR